MAETRQLLILMLVFVLLVSTGNASPAFAEGPDDVEETVQQLLVAVMNIQNRPDDIEARLDTMEQRVNAPGQTGQSGQAMAGEKAASLPDELQPATALPDGVKQVGETWEQDGMSLTLDSLELVGPEQVRPRFTIANNTSQTLNFKADDALKVTDNLGNAYKRCPKFPMYADNPFDGDLYTMPGNSSISFDGDYGCGGSCADGIDFCGPLWDEEVEYVEVSLQLARVKYAKWRMPVYH